MSFELKPQQLGYRRNAGPIVWSHPRDSVPALLANRVSLKQWQQTFDNVKSCIDLEQQIAAEMMGNMMNPCFMCCGSMGKMMAAEERVHQQWTGMLRTESAKYLPVGVQVSFAKELGTVGAGSHRHLSNQTVGLKFELVPGGGGAGGGVSGGSSDIVERLEKLNNLYKQGAITAEEYDKAKAKILGST